MIKGTKQSGMTLIELVVVIGIIGILSAIGVPMYNGYVSSAKAKAAQNTLQSIYMMEKDYFSRNYCYYITGTGDNAGKINTDLLRSSTASAPIVNGSGNDYTFYITGVSGSTCTASNGYSDDYVAYAKSKKDPTIIYSINQLNVRQGF